MTGSWDISWLSRRLFNPESIFYKCGPSKKNLSDKHNSVSQIPLGQRFGNESATVHNVILMPTTTSQEKRDLLARSAYPGLRWPLTKFSVWQTASHNTRMPSNGGWKPDPEKYSADFMWEPKWGPDGQMRAGR